MKMPETGVRCRRWWFLIAILLLHTVGVVEVVAEDSQVIRIENVKLRQIEAEKFTRISEYFTGRENEGRRMFLRSNSESRGGLYFIARFSKPLDRFPPDLKVGIDFYEAGSAQVRQYRYLLPERRKHTNKLFIGITEPGILDKTLPVAWRVCLEYPDGSLFAERKSYLWEMPEPIRDHQ